MFLPALHDERLVPGTAIGCNPKDPNQINPTTFMVATCALYALFKADALHALLRY